MKNYTLFLVNIFCLLSLASVITQSREYIKDYKSCIQVNKDRSMEVIENIIYVIEDKNTKRGIVRDFPTDYEDNYGNKVQVDFTVEQVKKDGIPENYKIEPFVNGKRIYIGNKDKFLSPGVYTYTIKYKTNRQLGFYEDHDELFWNVTGKWPFYIGRAQAFIKLPDNIPTDKIQVKAYTGYAGSQSQNYQVDAYSKDGDKNIISISTAESLNPQEQFSIVVKWPKGFIEPPTKFDYLYYLLRDNIWYLVLLLGFISVLSYYLWVYYTKVKPEQQRGTIIPLFYPPEDLKTSQPLTPGAVYYINNQKYDAHVLSSDIVNLAVQQFIIIDYKKKLLGLGTGTYTLTRTDKDGEKLPPEYQALLSALFKKGKSLLLDQSSTQIMSSVNNQRKNSLEIPYSLAYFKSYTEEYALWGILLSILFALPSYVFMFNSLNGLAPILVVGISVIAYLVVNVLFVSLFQGYSKAGIKVKDEIEGFKLFLSTTETERLKLIGTPPTKTPELYEEYLPYAIALGVEKQWSSQFVSVFKKLEEQHKPYQPDWYMGTANFRAANFAYFSSGLSTSLNSAINNSITIPSSQRAPGSSSGWGSGSGGSGGGGGGGGGGSW